MKFKYFIIGCLKKHLDNLLNYLETQKVESILDVADNFIMKQYTKIVLRVWLVVEAV